MVGRGEGFKDGDRVSVAVRPEKVCDHAEHAARAIANVFRGVVADIAYLGDLSVYKVRLESADAVESLGRQYRSPCQPACCGGATPPGSLLRRKPACCSEPDAMAGNAARFDRWYRRLTIGVPYLWFVIFLLVPFADRAAASGLSQTRLAQPPYRPVFDLAAGWQGIKNFVSALSFSNYRTLFSDWLYVSSYLREPAGRVHLDRHSADHRLCRWLTAWRARRAAAADAGDCGDPAVLDRVPDPRLCMDHDPAARWLAERRCCWRSGSSRARYLARHRHRDLYRHRLFLSAVHGAAALRDVREDGRDAARSRRRSRLSALEGVLAGDVAAGVARHPRRRAAVFHSDRRRVRHSRSARRFATR